MESLFHRKSPAHAAHATPYDLIEPEIVHLKKGYSIRYGKARKRTPLWLVALGFAGLIYLYLFDPIMHAWYKGEAIKCYVYLHNYGGGAEETTLATAGILSPDEMARLNQRRGSFQDYYASPQIAARTAQTIIDYMESVRRLHSGYYADLDPLGRMRYLLFIRTGLVLPKSWDFLDPKVTN